LNEENKNEAIGRYLRSARDQQGFSLLDVSAKTKISVSNLEYIENEQFSSLPNEVFVKGFLRSYAKVLGISESEILERFHQWKSQNLAHTVSENEKVEQDNKWSWPQIPLGRIRSLYYEDKRNVPGKMIVNILIVLAVILGVMILFSKRTPVEDQPGDSSASRPLSSPASEPLGIPPATSAPSTAAAVLPADSGAPPKPQGPNLHLIVQAIDRSWISVVIDDGITREFSLHPDDRISLDADKKFVLNIGNAGGVKVSLNGKPVGPFGKKGEIVKGIKLAGD
jgi:cytoskeletal protein RodZ